MNNLVSLVRIALANNFDGVKAIRELVNEDMAKKLTHYEAVVEAAREVIESDTPIGWAADAGQKIDALRDALTALEAQDERSDKCHAQKDGDCEWEECPQLRDGEPVKSGRDCPLDCGDDDYS